MVAQIEQSEARPRLGRKRDLTRDPEILDAALEVLAETGYDRMTIDMVASRAKAGKATLYRRWPSKADLVVDAVAGMKLGELDVDTLPDTGTLRGDLVAMIGAPSIRESERRVKIMAGIASMIARDPDRAASAREALIEPRASINRMFFQRAVERGEISADCDIERLGMVGPAMVAYRVLMLGLPVDREFLTANIDEIILPAAGIRPASA